jgi:hypothetical protein
VPRNPSTEQETTAARERARLEGESEGITLGRIRERNLIVGWLRQQTSLEAWRLAKLIEIGIHKEET